MKAGILIQSLGKDQKSIEITREINKIEKLDKHWDIIVFYLNYNRMFLTPKFATMNMVESYGFDGPTISTNIHTTKILLNSTGPTRKIFYMWDLEWTNKIYNVKKLCSVYMNPQIDLVVRSDEHAEIVERYWKKPVATIENFNYEQITKLLS